MSLTKGRMGAYTGAYLLLCGLGLLALELWGYSNGVTISEVFTSLWNKHPFVVLQIGMMAAFAWGCQVGHWFGREWKP